MFKRFSVQAIFLLVVGMSGALAQAIADEAEPEQYEFWAGGSATRDAWSLYSGGTMAVQPEGLAADGWRLRANAGFGRYSYDVRHGLALVSNSVDVNSMDAMAGYQGSAGGLTWKVFAGFAAVEQRSLFSDPGNGLLGRKTGGKGAVEVWFNVSEVAWTSLDTSYSLVHEAVAVRWRGGWRPDGQAWGPLSIGPEASFDSNIEGSSTKAGAFARYQWSGGEVSVSGGGISNAVTIGEDQGWDAYGSASALFKF